MLKKRLQFDKFSVMTKYVLPQWFYEIMSTIENVDIDHSAKLTN